MPTRTDRRNHLVDRFASFSPAIASALAALLVYAVTLGGTFVYDDFDVFHNDTRLRDPARWSEYWTDSYNGGVDNLYRPLVSMTYAVQWRLHGDEVKWPYHAVNWLLHAAVSAMVAKLAFRLAGHGRSVSAAKIAYVAGLLFATHPIHVEPVANVVGRAELMCALGFLSAMLLMLDRPLTIGRALAITACTVFSILCKEQGILLPAVLLAMWLALREKPQPANERTPRLVLALLLSWCVAGYILFREQILTFAWDRKFLDWTINPLVLSTGIDRWLMPIVILGHYVELMFLPLKLSPDYGATVIGWRVNWADPHLYLGMLAIAACGFALMIALRRRNALAIICLAALFLIYGLISNFAILIGTNLGERLMYLPSAFLLILIAMLLVRTLPHSTLIVFTIVAIGLLSTRTAAYAWRWNDRESFYRYSIDRQPRSIRLRMLLVAEMMSRQRLAEAAAVAAEARGVLPDYDEIWIQSADVEIARGDLDLAEKYLQQAIALTAKEKNILKASGRLQAVWDQRAATRPAAPK